MFARHGSKRLPGKNTRILGGKPLFLHAINLALDLDFVDSVFLSSDSEEMGLQAEEAGANFISRPEQLAEDTSPEVDAWKHAIAMAEEKNGPFSMFLSVPPTAPIRDKDDVRSVYEGAVESGVLAVGIAPARMHPEFNMVHLDTSSGMVTRVINPKGNLFRSQDAPMTYDITTVAFAARVEHVRNIDNLWDLPVKGVVLPKNRYIDIDDEIDFAAAQCLTKSSENLRDVRFGQDG